VTICLNNSTGKLFDKPNRIEDSTATIMSRKKDLKEEEMTLQNEEQTSQAENDANAGETESKSISREQALEQELAEAKDKHLRLFAEFDNYRKRTSKQQLDMIRNAGSDMIKTILPVLDDLDRAAELNEKTDDIHVVKEGFKLIHQKFALILERNGLKEIEAKGLEFNTDLHEAITNIPAPTEDLKGKVIDVVEKGYYLNDHVLRFSKVVVGQ
jgi:molecular chaperone GrpE